MGRRTIAFIPARGGSKSIPHKNIKEFCGKPLIYWVIDSLRQLEFISEIVVATDNQLIIDTVSSFNISQLSVYKRDPANATDTASTESVILEYINNCNIDKSNILLLVQATSPFTQPNHFKEAYQKYINTNSDSLLSCVRIKRFLWKEKGGPLNYDFSDRPRRQDFQGTLMENGAFYINTVNNILKTKNRLSGKIIFYEMPEFTGIEIDEEDDWMIAEKLMNKYIIKKKFSNSIKLFITDVDGVLTDAGMYYGVNGEELKKFNTHDGMAFQILRDNNIKTGIITSEVTKIVEKRAKKLNVDHLYQGKRYDGKLEIAKEICKKEGITLEEVAYIGDDINCYQLLSNVGIAACPANAYKTIKQIPSIHVLQKDGGKGVVREFVDLILSCYYAHNQ